MKDNIMFSVIVPIYNVEEYLEKCINSVLNQTYKSFELILVDDGSTDTSSLICDAYKEKDSRIQVVHKENGGLVSARKYGVMLAKGDYVVCLDGDDWIDKNYMAELKKIIDTCSPSIICFNHYMVNGDNINTYNIGFRKGFYTKKDIENEIFPSLIQTVDGKAFPPTIWAKVYKSDLYKSKQLSVDDGIKIGEDAACTIPCMISAENIYILDKALYFYRTNNNSMTKNRKPFPWKGPDLIELHLRQQIKISDWDFQNQISRRTVKALFNVVKTQFYSDKKYSVIKKEIKSNLRKSIYQNAINDSQFKKFSVVGAFSLFLKHDIFFPFYLLSKIR